MEKSPITRSDKGRYGGAVGALRLSPLGRWDRETDKRCGESDKRKAPTKTPNHPLSLRETQHFLCSYNFRMHQ
ncbi:hypothetical protein KSF_080670 [Reticulibacter mediterranei]|uniref:Uncharacterized protein n=1 Tax=Reticulibacter mediterranei TaxID=2778369 RepID=A0A8J3N4G9_9CHLR|nr:hypothetical protein KSF_080670 [Reticulibacter mediterranei]